MSRYKHFDPYATDKERKKRETIAWRKSQSRAKPLSSLKAAFAGIKRRKPRPVTLAGPRK